MELWQIITLSVFGYLVGVPISAKLHWKYREQLRVFVNQDTDDKSATVLAATLWPIMLGVYSLIGVVVLICLPGELAVKIITRREK